MEGARKFVRAKIPTNKVYTLKFQKNAKWTYLDGTMLTPHDLTQTPYHIKIWKDFSQELSID